MYRRSRPLIADVKRLMPTFRCTKKLLDQFEIKTCSAPDLGLDDWHANLLLIERRKLILFCSDLALFCCVSEPFTKNQNKTIETIFLSALETAMRYENFSNSTIDNTLGNGDVPFSPLFSACATRQRSWGPIDPRPENRLHCGGCPIN